MIFRYKGNPTLQASHQASVDLQLAVTLYRLGRNGNGNSLLDISYRFGISEGCVILYTNRIIQAILTTMSLYIKWPTTVDMANTSTRLSLRGFPGCIGFVDGTSIPFYDKPLDCPEDYYSRKQEYAMQLQIVADDNKRIIHIYTGMPASVHDSTVFRRSNIVIPEDKYILADSAYSNTNTVITPFRKRLGPRPIKERIYNRQLSSVRVSVEHVIGILKNRFQSLRGLRIRINKNNGHKKACEWITACCILYNIIQECDPWDDMDQPDDDDEEEPDPTDRSGAGRRMQLVDHIWRLKNLGII